MYIYSDILYWEINIVMNMNNYLLFVCLFVLRHIFYFWFYSYSSSLCDYVTRRILFITKKLSSFDKYEIAGPENRSHNYYYIRCNPPADMGIVYPSSEPHMWQYKSCSDTQIESNKIISPLSWWKGENDCAIFFDIQTLLWRSRSIIFLRYSCAMEIGRSFPINNTGRTYINR